MQDRDCPRCGSLLPDADEGVCQTCGYEYGRATTMMPALVVPQPEDPQELPEGLDAPRQAAPSMVPVGSDAPTQEPEAQRRKLMMILGALVLLLVLAAGLLFYLYTSP